MFPRTVVGGVSLSRMLIGTNWFLGWSHCTAAKDDYIKEHIAQPKKIAEILEVFLGYGVDTIMGFIQRPQMYEAIQIAQERTGKQLIVISTPGLPNNERTAADGFDEKAVCDLLDKEAELGTTVCMPHTSTTDIMVDKCTREVRQMAPVCQWIREQGMVPGLSTHVPETIIYADETGLDVETYISIYNALGFLMQIEVDWINRVIHNAKKPVMTIKPMAAGQLRPFQAMTFSWNSLRDCDMVTAGTMAPKEAAELCEMSLSILERRHNAMPLQETRSKATVKPRAV